MHANEIVVDPAMVGRLLAEQFPAWAHLPLVRLPPAGTDNLLFRLGDDLLLRFPRIPDAAAAVTWEADWLPKLAPHVDLPVPVPVAVGEPGAGYPWPWTVVPWLTGATPTSENIDPDEWATRLGSFVGELRRVPAMGGPVKTAGRGGPLATEDGWVRTWAARLDRELVDPDAVLAVWHDALDAPVWDEEPAWLHGDLHADNLLTNDGRLAAVLDWGASAGRGDPAVDLNAMWTGMPASAVELYRDTVGLDEAAYRRGRGFALAPAVSGVTYYRDTAPHLAREFLTTLRTLVASL